jgi:hypothetical protein
MDLWKSVLRPLLRVVLVCVAISACDEYSPVVYRENLIGTFSYSDIEVSEILELVADGTFRYVGKVKDRQLVQSGKWEFKIDKKRPGELGHLVLIDFVSVNPNSRFLGQIIWGVTPGYSRDRKKIEICYDSDRKVCMTKPVDVFGS